MQPKVLIVEDEELMRLMQGQFLKRLGCWCVMAADVRQARNRIEEHDLSWHSWTSISPATPA